jgi:hypothetical protein
VAYRKKEHLTAEQIRERVDRIMDDWRSFPDFAHLFDAVLSANGISERAFAEQFSRATGSATSETKIHDIRHGNTRPPYQLIAGIVDHALLSLDPKRLAPAAGGQRSGDHRAALFGAANLIEVTPDSVREWNSEVLAAWDRRRQDGPNSSVTWKQLINKLLSFHMQAGRWRHSDIAEAANAVIGDASFDEERLHHLLSHASAMPTAVERRALARSAGLDSAQTDRIEAAIEYGLMPLSHSATCTPFSALFKELLARLRAAGISQVRLVSHSTPPGRTEPDLSASCISSWKTGRSRPTVAGLRGLVRALDRCREPGGEPLVTPEEVRNLVRLAGFSIEELAATTHDVVARINEDTRLKPLLSAIRNAADLSVPTSVLSAASSQNGADAEQRQWRMLKDWENEGSDTSPNPTQVRGLLEHYNRLLFAKGHPQMTVAEIDKVIAVAERDREDGRKRGFRKRAAEYHPLLPRRTITPDFDGGPTR